MSGQLLIGVGHEVRAVPDEALNASMKQLAPRMARRLAFMSREHHIVRDFVVRELPRQEVPLSPRQIAQVTALPESRVATILEELERHLFFLVRDRRGNVSWAFPVTVSPTPHRLTFSTGERISGA